MANESIKIMNWKNGLLLSTVSYMLYLILWFILDDETAGQLPEMAIADYIIDYLLCMLFTYISLGFSFWSLGYCHLGHLMCGRLSMLPAFLP